MLRVWRGVLRWLFPFRETTARKRIVAITNQPLEKPDFADSFVSGLEGPEVVIDTIRND